MPQIISEADARYALDLVKAICREVGPGLPATPQERARAEIIMKELESHLGAENVTMEEFKLAPGALLNTFPGVVCMLVTVLLNISIESIAGISPWIISLGALLFSLFMPVTFILEFFLSREVFDLFYPQKTSINVIGRLHKPGNENPNHLLILSGHHDSAPENIWLRYIGYGFYFFSAIFFVGMVTLVVMCLIQLVGLIISNSALVHAGTLGWILLVFPIIPSMIYALFLTRGKKNGGIVPGAADNLSACAVVVAMCRFLVQNPDYIPEDTEIRFISFGSEEVGLRGSRRYVKRHLEELRRMEARLLNYEIIAHPQINIPASDVNGTVKNQPEMIESAVAAAKRAGVPYRMSSGGLGAGSDAAPFIRAGINAITLLLFKTPEQFIAFYHQDRDTPNVLSIEPFVNALILSIEWIRYGGK